MKNTCKMSLVQSKIYTGVVAVSKLYKRFLMKKFDPTQLVESQLLKTFTLLRIAEWLLGVLILLIPAIAIIIPWDIQWNKEYLVLLVIGSVVYVAVSLGCFVIFHRSIRVASHHYSLMKKEINWKNLIIGHTNEIVILLDTLGQIITFNPALLKLLKFEKDDLIQKPFRTILYDKSFEDNIQLKDLLLCRFRDVFIGNEAEVVLPCRVKNTSNVHTISFRMIPILTQEELQHILVVGRLTQSDVLTGKFLKHESSRYVIGNNVSLVNLLTYRLTRNLENRLEQGVIISMQLGIQEVLINAIEHGNLGIDFKTKSELRKKEGNYWELVMSVSDNEYLMKRTIDVSHQMDEEKVIFTVKDEGDGFDWQYYMSLQSENINTGLLESFHGIGLQMVKSVFDVSFNEKGNEVILVKYFDNGDKDG